MRRRPHRQEGRHQTADVRFGDYRQSTKGLFLEKCICFMSILSVTDFELVALKCFVSGGILQETTVCLPACFRKPARQPDVS